MRQQGIWRGPCSRFGLVRLCNIDPLRFCRFLSPFRTVEEHPGGEVFGEILESVLDSGRGEENFSCLERLPDAVLNEEAGAGDDDINLIASMRLLMVHFVRFVDFDFKRAMPEEGNEFFARGLSKGC